MVTKVSHDPQMVADLVCRYLRYSQAYVAHDMIGSPHHGRLVSLKEEINKSGQKLRDMGVDTSYLFI